MRMYAFTHTYMFSVALKMVKLLTQDQWESLCRHPYSCTKINILHVRSLRRPHPSALRKKPSLIRQLLDNADRDQIAEISCADLSQLGDDLTEFDREKALKMIRASIAERHQRW